MSLGNDRYATSEAGIHPAPYGVAQDALHALAYVGAIKPFRQGCQSLVDNRVDYVAFRGTR